MNTAMVRARFKRYRQQIQELNDSIEDAYAHRNEVITRAGVRADACRREADERERQAESDRWYKGDQLRSATKDLERARSYGDEYGIERALRKLKSIY